MKPSPLQGGAPAATRFVRMALIALVLTACSDRSPTEVPQSGVQRSAAPAPGITVSTSASPAQVRPGETISVRFVVSNQTAKRVSVDLQQTVRGPSGQVVRSRTWQKQNIAAGKSLMIEDAFAPGPEGPAGAYLVGVRLVSNDQRALYHDDPAATIFTVLPPPRYIYTRAADPARTVVTDLAGSWLATFTDGARTVALAGPTRTFAEPEHTSFTVTHSTWVRVLPAAFTGVVDELWLTDALANHAADMLEIAMQYIQNAPPLFDGTGFQIGGDADYGPLQPDGTRKEGADYNDYLGIPWPCGDGTARQPRQEFFRSIDCTGYVQMVFGYRGGLPLACRPNGIGIPRTARDALASAPGIVVIPNTGVQVTDFSRLQIGDLVFFDASDKNGTEIDHVGIYLGWDSRYHRFISSRKGANGPTLGDTGGRSSLSGGNTYAVGFRATRRL